MTLKEWEKLSLREKEHFLASGLSFKDLPRKILDEIFSIPDLRLIFLGYIKPLDEEDYEKLVSFLSESRPSLGPVSVIYLYRKIPDKKKDHFKVLLKVLGGENASVVEVLEVQKEK